MDRLKEDEEEKQDQVKLFSKNILINHLKIYDIKTKPSWSVLRDDFIMGDKIKEWDENGNDENGDEDDEENSEDEVKAKNDKNNKKIKPNKSKNKNKNLKKNRNKK